MTRALYQYDYGQTLTFEDFELGETVEVHFGNKGEDETVVCYLDAEGVKIPDELLKTGKDIDAWIYLHNSQNEGESVYHVIIPVMKRAKFEYDETNIPDNGGGNDQPTGGDEPGGGEEPGGGDDPNGNNGGSGGETPIDENDPNYQPPADEG